jgi:hypothetical protein
MSEVRRMWEGGPLRQWSAKRTNTTGLALGHGGFAGSYVCDGCQRSVDGLYDVREAKKWLCGACREARKPHVRRKA